MDYGAYLLNDGWEFLKLPVNTRIEAMRLSPEPFSPVGLPHDWLIYQTSALSEDGTGWYRKYLSVPAGEFARGRLYLLRFEGVYMDSTVYLNGQPAAHWKYGYSTFEVDITAFIQPGSNEILVRVNHQAPNSRWYSGAGIYRDVWLKVIPAVHFISDGTYVTVRKEEEDNWRLQVETELHLPGTEEGARDYVEYQLVGMADNAPVCFADKESVKRISLQEAENDSVSFEAVVKQPLIWDITAPNRYELQATLYLDGTACQQERYTVGFRTISFSPSQGFLLNERKLKLQGVCEHHDLGCLGAAYHSQAMRRKLKLLKEMGVNALRLAHNMPAPDVMELADEMGFLVVSEAFDMWERSKTPYDYARFFPEWYQRDVASWVRRDRNHPSLIMWSIGNEIYDTHVSHRGRELTGKLLAEVQKHDWNGHAPVTIASNYMPWENAAKCADILKLAGYNYAEEYYDRHHEEHPDWIIYGSETGATVQSRSVYHFPFKQSLLADEDRQCSALGNAATSWGAASSEACILAERDHPYSCGQFLWTGFDYIGEPTPYHTRNSYFGQLDTAGFPKDSYYIYQAAWTDGLAAPMVHIFPYWDFNEGQLIDVRICSNMPRIELFLNGQSQGEFEIDHRHGTRLVGHWQIPFVKGEIRACGYDGEGRMAAEEVRHSFGEAAQIILQKDRDGLSGNGRDLVFVEISVQDQEGFPVENAANRIWVKVSGAARLVGLDNGDSTDTDAYKTDSRRLFNGKLLAVIASERMAGEAVITVGGNGLMPRRLTLPVTAADEDEKTKALAYGGILPAGISHPEVPVRAIRLFSSYGTHLHRQCLSTLVRAVLHPADAADREVVWTAVNDAGIPSALVRIKAQGLTAAVTALSDGAFRLRCMSKAGTDHIRLLSELDFTITGLGKAWLDPYSFISGGLYDYARGKVGNGNEHGVATARDGETQVGFSGLDFGDYGSDEIRIPIFALTDEAYPLQIWEGWPEDAGSRLVADVVYQKPAVWNTYQEETFRLKTRLKGVTSLCFVFRQKVHLKGFIFTRLIKAYQMLGAAECSQVYGDTFEAAGNSIRNIGNNVTLRYEQMDFGCAGTGSITICGETPLELQGIQIRFESQAGTHVQLVGFRGQAEPIQTFALNPEYGLCTVSFVFLPGSRFDLHWFQFK